VIGKNSNMQKIIIGTRGSELALWQAHNIEGKLKDLGVEVEIQIIKTQGDAIQHLSFDKMEGKGFFTKEIEAALMSKEIDLAVHSHKDLETTPPKGLSVAAISERADASDTLVIRKESYDGTLHYGLKKGAIVGTSSARRKSQIIAARPDVSTNDLRGNVPTRLQKLRDQNYDAIILASAGIARLEIDLGEFEVVKFDPKAFVPAPAQGALALQVRDNDIELFDFLQKNLHKPELEKVVHEERIVLKSLEGGCQLPLGVYCEQNEDGSYSIWGAYKGPLGFERANFTAEKPEGLGQKVLEYFKKKS
jgi:hydroxymethylbilane synthase